MAKIWIDVEDLFIYGASGVRPSGIQRLEFELCRALIALPQSKGRVFFVRHDEHQRCLATTTWEAVEALFEQMSGGRLQTSGGLKTASVMPRSVLRRALDALPSDLRRIILLQFEVIIGLIRFVLTPTRALERTLRRRRRSRKKTLAVFSSDHFAFAARPGDTIVALGSPWITRDYASYIERAVRHKGLRFALLVYDIIPLRRPEWVDEKNVLAFRAWFDDALSSADTIFTISAATAEDVVNYGRNRALTLRAAPTPIPIGAGFKRSNVGERRSANTDGSSRLPPPNTYALIVSTIEARKNHALLFAVWRRLLEDMPAATVPTLVFAGRVGWLVSDLMQQLRNSNFLDGKIVHIDSPTDQELEALYDGCLFTVFPSFYEGWGLPVTESHAFGRPCIASKTTSLPEAGGSLARYIDPDNTTDAYGVIRETIEDRASLRKWRDRVQREFRPVEWSQSACAVLRVLDTPDSARSTLQATE
jgi:glycosyltransferase involved in cell wall biosynthesis